MSLLLLPVEVLCGRLRTGPAIGLLMASGPISRARTKVLSRPVGPLCSARFMPWNRRGPLPVAFGSLWSAMMPVIGSCPPDVSFSLANPGMLGSLRNTGLPRFATSAFKLAMLRCCVRFLPAVVFVLGIICRSPTGVGNLTAPVRTVNRVATLYVGVCCARDLTTSPVTIGAQL